ncbi:MAG TPA: sigma 54-interacting transcriptional regulator, partial [Kofleriaceae bacterium]|nr:sigma 54-interacting transcriptional regulator [Kofleriaceae bacterium]
MDLDGATAVKVRSRGPAASGSVAALTIAAHPDPSRVGDRLVLTALAAGREVELARQSPDFVRPSDGQRAPLGDRCLSRRPIRLVPASFERILIARGDSTTIVEIGDRELDAAELGPLAAGEGVPIALADRLVLVLHLVEAADVDDAAAGDDLGMIGSGSGVRRVRREIAQIRDLPVPVLVRGETGTGRELVARALHEGSARRGGPFVSVNLAAIAKELAAAELFGAVRGAYTGAAGEREGYFRAAAGGTLFLDEVGEASPEVQAMLLRVIETGELYPVGGPKPIATDVRLIAATDARLEARIDDGRFKAPLLHRLAGHEVHLPPLRDRPEDIGPLFLHFAREELAATGELDRLAPRDAASEPWLPAAVAAALVRFQWPGNIRQLRNVTRQLVVASRGREQVEVPARLAAELAAGARPLPVARGS